MKRWLPKFSIGGLLGLIVLSALGCWWWIPTANDARETQYLVPVGEPISELDVILITGNPNRIVGPVGNSTRRFRNLGELMAKENDFSVFDSAQQFDFEVRDLVLVPAAVGMSVQSFQKYFGNGKSLEIQSRLGGRLVLAVSSPESHGDLGTLVDVSKSSDVFRVSRTVANLLDVVVGLALCVPTIRLLWFGTNRRQSALHSI